MLNMKNERNYKKSPRKNIGFYISLAVCLAAVAGAAWTTYGSIQEYSQPSEESSIEQSENEKVNEEVSGQEYEKSETEESSKPESSESSQESSRKSEESQTSRSEQSSRKPVEPSVQQTAAEESEPLTAEPIDKGEVLKPFSPKNPVKSETMGDWRTHSGVDIKAGEGTPVRAVMSGVIKDLYADPMLGNVIVIEHSGGYESLYCGVTDTSIATKGSSVKAGDTIGYIGKIPSESKDEPHLHLEVKLDGNNMDPTLIY